jgi:N-acylneuraminate cytidylyltransferase
MGKVAIITARGGSKRIPRKNIKDFLGKPIIAYSIQAALASGVFDEVMVSTEDGEIMEVSRRYGAQIPFSRSAAAADDYATTFDVVYEVVNEYAKRGRRFDWLCCLYPTAPFVSARVLTECMDKILQEKADGLIPIVRFSFPPQRAFILDEKGGLCYKWPENRNKRSQDLEAFYHDAGQFYFMRTEKLLSEKTMLFEKTVPYVIDDAAAQDIDNLDDWAIAEIKCRLLWEKQEP